MSDIIDWLKNLTDSITSLIDFVIDFIGDIVDMVVMVGQAAATIPQLFALVPAPVSIALVSGIAVAVLYKILGREG